MKNIKESIGRDLVGVSNYASRNKAVSKILEKYPTKESLYNQLIKLSETTQNNPKLSQKYLELANACKQTSDYNSYVKKIAGFSKLWSTTAKVAGAAVAAAGATWLIKDLVGEYNYEKKSGQKITAGSLAKGTAKQMKSDAIHAYNIAKNKYKMMTDKNYAKEVEQQKNNAIVANKNQERNQRDATLKAQNANDKARHNEKISGNKNNAEYKKQQLVKQYRKEHPENKELNYGQYGVYDPKSRSSINTDNPTNLLNIGNNNTKSDIVLPKMSGSKNVKITPSVKTSVSSRNINVGSKNINPKIMSTTKDNFDFKDSGNLLKYPQQSRKVSYEVPEQMRSIKLPDITMDPNGDTSVTNITPSITKDTKPEVNVSGDVWNLLHQKPLSSDQIENFNNFNNPYRNINLRQPAGEYTFNNPDFADMFIRK